MVDSSSQVCIALDTMGGDNAPEFILAGAEIALQTYPNVHFLLYGDENQIGPLLPKFSNLALHSTIYHTSDFIAADTKPSIALRQGKNSSMQLAISAVKEGDAQAVVSAGNTGALMAMAKLTLRPLDSIHRPAIASQMPTLRGKSIFLDLGANVECDENNLFQFAIMGSAFARVIQGQKKPIVGLLNIGSEVGKGHEVLNSTHTALTNMQDTIHIDYYGFIEGTDIGKGTVDVVVTDGFSGNVALKTMEGTAIICKEFLKNTFRKSFLSKLGFFLAKKGLKALFNQIDPRHYNGALFLGLTGVCVKSHGGTDKIGFANAISVAVESVTNDINDKIMQEINAYAHATTEEKVMG